MEDLFPTQFADPNRPYTYGGAPEHLPRGSYKKI